MTKKNVNSDLSSTMEEKVPEKQSEAEESCGEVVKGNEQKSTPDPHSTLPLIMPPPPPTPCYYGYYYLGNDGFAVGLDDQANYVSNDHANNGVELQYPVMQGDDGSFIYMMPGFQPAYAPPYSPYVIPTVGADGQYAVQQPLSPVPMYQQSVMSPGYYPAGELMPTTYMWDPSVFVGDGGAYANVYTGTMEIPNSKINKFSANKPSLEISSGHGTRKQSKPVSKASTFQSELFGKGYIPNSKFQLYTPGKVGSLYSAYPANSKTKAHIWSGPEKAKSGKTNNIEEFEHNHARRTTNAKISSISDINGDSKASLIKKDQYNLPDFPTTYDQAFFFIIKSYSEDDIHRSIKYNVWASTPNGNKRLDAAYQEAQSKAAEKGSNCPVFLFFSVNASGQFCGVAEMTGRVDFNKSMDFWQQDKWNGYFPVKWHILKDVPNPQLRHIVLEYNDNKPVTNSRDTQEVRFPQGIEMLNILKNYASKTSILDDFDFYESRQKVMQEKRLRSSRLHVDTQQNKGADELAARLNSELQVTE
ncbi:hypothetical protein ACFE04_024284 [Oxalis oulophora]